MMKKITSLLLLWVMVLPLWAQFHDPVSFSVSQKKLSDSELFLPERRKRVGMSILRTFRTAALLRLPLISMNRKEWSR